MIIIWATYMLVAQMAMDENTVLHGQDNKNLRTNTPSRTQHWNAICFHMDTDTKE